jgi:hypothetical protein
MWALDDEEMESFSKLDLRDVLWWKSIKDACRLAMSVTNKLSKEGCISLVARGKPSRITRKQD